MWCNRRERESLVFVFHAARGHGHIHVFTRENKCHMNIHIVNCYNEKKLEGLRWTCEMMPSNPHGHQQCSHSEHKKIHTNNRTAGTEHKQTQKTYTHTFN